MINRRSLVLSGVAAPFVATSSLQARAQVPNNLLRITIPFTPGTTPDSIARVMSPVLQKHLDSAVVVENKAGASGLIGIRSVAQSNDPAMLQIISSTALMIPLFYKQADFDMLKTFTPVTHVASSAFVLTVNGKVPVNNLSEFTAWVKNTPQAYYASPGNGTHHHLFMEMLLQKLGIKLEHVTYKGFASAFNDLMGGQIHAMFVPIQVAVPQRDAGRIKIIGSSLRDRHPGFPAIPSLNELGATGFHADPWYGVWGSPKVTPELAQIYHGAFAAAMEDETVKTTLGKQGLILRPSTPAELQGMAKKEYEMWTRVIREANIRPE